MGTCSYGHQNPAGTQFCSTCGLAILADDPQASPPSAPGAAPAVTPPPGFSTLPPFDAAPPLPTRNRGWVLPVVLVAILGVIALGIVVYQAAKPKTTSMTVTMDLYNGTDGCNVGLGYDDIPGAAVVVTADGSQVGFGSLDYSGTDMGYYCEFTALLTGIPTDKSTYELTIGGPNRGVLTSTQSELSANGWDWGVSLGNQ